MSSTGGGNTALHVVKIGGSALPDAAGYDRAAALLEALSAARPLACVVSAQRGHTDELLRDIAALEIPPDPSRRAEILATGERRSAALLVASLAARGCAAEVVSSRETFVLRGDPCAADVSGVRLEATRAVLERGRLPVVPGFIGVREDSDELATMGRGGGDLAAVALAHALGAERAVLVKGDVSGLYTHDPGLRPEDAVRIESMTLDDMHEVIAADGVEVVQLAAVAYARRHGVTLEVRGPGNQAGTLVVPAPRP